MRPAGRSRRRATGWIAVLLLTVVWPLTGVRADGDPSHAMTRHLDPVEIEGRSLETLLGVDLARLVLRTWTGEAFREAPLQVDERTPDGTMILMSGPGARPGEANHRLDPQDIVVFRARAAGPRAPEEARADLPARSAEIELTDPVRGEKGYVYLVRGTPGQDRATPDPGAAFVQGGNGEPYAFRFGTGSVRGRINRIGNEIQRPPVFDAWFPLDGRDGPGPDLLDVMKVRIRLGFLFNSIKLSVDEQDLLGGIEGTRSGPVRFLGRFWLRGRLPLGIQSPRAYMDVYLYDGMIFVPGQFKVLMNPGYVISSLSIQFGYDLSEKAVGMRFYNSNNPEGFLIDGRMDERERAMDTAIDEWRAVVGPQGAMVTTAVWDERYRRQAELHVCYEDDREHRRPPEDEPGSIGFHYNTSRVRGLEPGTYRMLLGWFFPEVGTGETGLPLERIQAFLDIRKRPLRVRTGGHSFENPAGWPAVFSPE